MKPLIRWTVSLCLGWLAGLASSHADPVVSNVSFIQRSESRLVDVFYDLGGSGPLPTVALQVSADGGASFAVPVNSVSGDVGTAVAYGTGKHMVWDANADWPGQFSSQVRCRVSAWDLALGGVPYALIPGGNVLRGDSLDGDGDAPPQTLYLSPFYIQTNLVTKAQWDSVRTWGAAHGYTDLAAGDAKGSDHPVVTVTWYHVIKWCNAASEKDGCTPCYTSDGAVIRTGTPEIVTANWTAGGYRLPTEAEWEKAARGGLVGRRFPWGDTISLSQASFYSTDLLFYDVSPTHGWNATYAVGSFPFTSPVGSFAPNGYGLYDMAGNVFEWCWDWYGTYVAEPDPKGPESGPGRLLRGGNWNSYPNYARCCKRYSHPPVDSYINIGFRPVRGRL